ncbi:hypothetical protein HBE96_05865 [Clostridium sp. P21]|uniref:Uncharacterized protein n=1 Tax=Clostridium muellerianum TaxID=2716538 RepID=A0A7Y0EF25_9CLOT|nr:hypothetical protein [Clostridium muellerianum]NMM62218.1 hypothetical protein [Clostridium muellerianum]
MSYGKRFLWFSDSIFYIKDISNRSSFDREKASILKLNVNNNQIKIEYITFCLPDVSSWEASGYEDLHEYFIDCVKGTKKLDGYYDWNSYNGYYDEDGNLKYEKPICMKNRIDLTIEKVKELLTIHTTDFDKDINDFINYL